MTIAEFDHLAPDAKKAFLLQCCGSSSWADKMIKMPPVEDLIDLFEDAEEKWYECDEIRLERSICSSSTDWGYGFFTKKIFRRPICRR